MFDEDNLEFIQSPLEECRPDIFQQWAHSDKNLRKNFQLSPNDRHPIQDFLLFDRDLREDGLFISDLERDDLQQGSGLVQEMPEEHLLKNGTPSMMGLANQLLDYEEGTKKKEQLKETEDQQFILQPNCPATIEYLEIQSPGKDDLEVRDTKKEEKALKLKKKISKFVLKNEQFKGSDKISLPKKLGKLFVNYIDKFANVDDPDVSQFNLRIKNDLKKNVKNDYTFQKTVLRFLGECDAEGGEVDPSLGDKISQLYRSSMAQIIRDTMKEEVIMKQKIERNRQIYMLQLKVYNLRCRSHRLAQKGSFK